MITISVKTQIPQEYFIDVSKVVEYVKNGSNLNNALRSVEPDVARWVRDNEFLFWSMVDYKFEVEQ